MSRGDRAQGEALRAAKINLSQAEVSTLSDDAKQIEATLEHAIYNRNSADTIRRMLVNSAVEHTHRKAVYVGMEAYSTAGGTLTKDLFGDSIYLNDAALLDTLFTAKLEAEAQAQASEWAWIVTCENSQYASWEAGYTTTTRGKSHPYRRGRRAAGRYAQHPCA